MLKRKLPVFLTSGLILFTSFCAAAGAEVMTVPNPDYENGSQYPNQQQDNRPNNGRVIVQQQDNRNNNGGVVGQRGNHKNSNGKNCNSANNSYRSQNSGYYSNQDRGSYSAQGVSMNNRISQGNNRRQNRNFSRR